MNLKKIKDMYLEGGLQRLREEYKKLKREQQRATEGTVFIVGYARDIKLLTETAQEYKRLEAKGYNRYQVIKVFYMKRNIYL